MRKKGNLDGVIKIRRERRRARGLAGPGKKGNLPVEGTEGSPTEKKMKTTHGRGMFSRGEFLHRH
jgi:hypothetical protein